VMIAMLGSGACADASPRPVVIELFTSQGCSSCPPADEYVGKLSTRPDVIALAFHVNYWDDLGWRDRFALTEAVDRQNVYARNLRRSSVYTPQLIVDGLDDSAGTHAKLSAVEAAVPLTITLAAGDLQVDIGTHPQSSAGDVILVSYLHHSVSAVGRGENAGRKLDEFNIVRSIQKLGSLHADGARFTVPLVSLPTDVTDVAVLVQESGQKAIMGAATRPLR
jgi:hypothetical protein